MKPIFVSVLCEGKTTCVYDLTKVSMVCRINETSYKMIIDGQEGLHCYATKDDCDKNFNFVVDNLLKLMKEATE